MSEKYQLSDTLSGEKCGWWVTNYFREWTKIFRTKFSSDCLIPAWKFHPTFPRPKVSKEDFMFCILLNLSLLKHQFRGFLQTSVSQNQRVRWNFWWLLKRLGKFWSLISDFDNSPISKVKNYGIGYYESGWLNIVVISVIFPFKSQKEFLTSLMNFSVPGDRFRFWQTCQGKDLDVMWNTRISSSWNHS